jgi:AcrR family transcriptional regulator
MPSDKAATTRKTRVTPVSVAEIAHTALGLLDEVGLEGLTMRRLAGVIGVEPMTLYRYLPNKEAILAEVADLLWQELPPFAPDVHGWRATVRTMWSDLYQLMVRHPHAVPLIARAGSYSRTATEGTARMLGVLKDAGFSPELATQFLHTTGALVVGFAHAHLWQQLEAQGQRPSAPAGEMSALSPEILAFAQAIGPWTQDQFQTALDIVITGFASRVVPVEVPSGQSGESAP